jgi:hypothetical protein
MSRKDTHKGASVEIEERAAAELEDLLAIHGGQNFSSGLVQSSSSSPASPQVTKILVPVHDHHHLYMYMSATFTHKCV